MASCRADADTDCAPLARRGLSVAARALLLLVGPAAVVALRFWIGWVQRIRYREDAFPI